MHSNRPMWIFTLVLAIFAAFAAYPPRDVVKRVERVRLSADGKTVMSEKPELIRENPMPFPFATPHVEYRDMNPQADGTIIADRYTIIPARIRTGLDIAGGAELVYRLKAGDTNVAALTRDTIDTLRRRIDPSGTKEYRIQEQGYGRILIQVPRATQTDVNTLKAKLERLGKLEFKICATSDRSVDRAQAQLYDDAAKGLPTPGYVRMDVYDPFERRAPGQQLVPGRDWLLVSAGEAPITGRDLASVQPSYDNQGRPAIGFQLKQRAAAKFGTLTETFQNKPLAIILDNTLRSAPTIRSRITSSGIIEGSFTQEEIRETIAVLRAGSLPVDLELEMESTVGPSLGGDSVRKGIMASVTGAILVLALMAGYYYYMGVVANVALMLNLLFLLGAMCLMRSTLTLPGIAGIALTLGMAVDANVLIYERIREECNRSRQLKLALKNGYDRAFLTIFDSNITTLLTAIVLYMVGTGPVRGFAITLGVGIVISMFTALVVTRMILEWLMGRGVIQEFKMRSLFSKPNFPFVAMRKYAYAGSAAFVILGLVVHFARGKDAYDIDFTGGALVHVRMAKPTPADEVRAAMRTKGYEFFEVQSERTRETAATAGENPSEFAIRVRDIGPEKENEKIRADIEAALKSAGLFKSLDLDPATKTLRIELAREIPKNEFYDLLTGAEAADFSSEEIAVIRGDATKKTNDFEIRHDRSQESIDDAAQIMRLVRAVESSLPLEKIKVALKSSEPVQPLRQSEERQAANAPAIFTVEIESDKPVTPLMLEAVLRKAGITKFSIRERQTTVLPDKGRFYDLSAVEAVARDARDKLQGEMELPKIASAGNSFSVSLTEPLNEDEFLQRLGDGLPAHSVVIPVGHPSSIYTVRMNELGPGKRQDKVRDDIIQAFQGNLYQEKIEATLISAAEADKPATPAQPAVEDAAAAAAAVEAVPEDENARWLTFSTAVSGSRINELFEEVKLKQATELKQHLLEEATYDRVKVYLTKERADELLPKIQAKLADPTPIRRIVSIGATVAGEMKTRAWLALVFSWIVIIAYVAFRFHGFSYGVTGVIALVHDVLTTLAAISLASLAGGLFGDMKIGLTVIASFLTLIGYSINDTIVIYDRIRENLGGVRGRKLDAKLVDDSLNQTLARTIMTSMTTFLVMLTLYFFGGSTLRTMNFALLFGIITGSYSSLFIAAQLLVDWEYVAKVISIIFKTLTVPFWGPGWLLNRGKSTAK
ncbi:MAG TPA: protein translocase subunit SecD [Candidatus Brocadiia bacterium]|nr:protein translocase subunit SecD [Candidatus Brocadiia bacterium]